MILCILNNWEITAQGEGKSNIPGWKFMRKSFQLVYFASSATIPWTSTSGKQMALLSIRAVCMTDCGK